MTDELDKDKLEQPVAGAPAPEVPPVVDDWATAFDTLAAQNAPADAGAEDGSGAGAATPGAEDPAAAAPANGAVLPALDADLGAADDGGLVPPVADAAGGDAGSTPEDVEAVIARYTQEVDERATLETAQKFLEGTNAEGQKLIRQTDGKMGATINDPDIYRVENGVPTFFNPDTGKPFTGDNPRAQAKAWVEEYNEELRDTFNKYAEERAQELQQEIAPVINLLKFTPTYDKLDPVRQKMLDALLDDYEVTDKAGDVIGYSVDLDKALAQVNKQIRSIQESRPAAAPAAPTGPALDMPNSGNESVNRAEVKSLADAMELIQNEQLAKQKPANR